MLEEILSLTIDVLFLAVGIGVVAAQLARRRGVPALRVGPTVTWLELVLTAAALTVAAVGPNVLVFALTPGMPGMPVLARNALVPSLLLFGVVWTTAAGLGQRRLANRIWVGLWVGATTTGVLDAIRLTGFQLGLMPGNMPRMFGVLILDRMALGPSLGSDILGYLYHYWVGACFGLTYTLLLGRFRWWGGLVWGLIIEVGMMVTPPMVVAMDTGYFGVKFGPGLFATSLVAHIAYGSVLGVLAERYIVHRENLFGMLRNKFRHLEDAGAQHAVVEPVTGSALAIPTTRKDGSEPVTGWPVSLGALRAPIPLCGSRPERGNEYKILVTSRLAVQGDPEWTTYIALTKS